MDYQEAIEILRYGLEIPEQIPHLVETYKTAISAIQELQICKENEKRNLSRTDRLMDECTYRHENGNCLKVGGFCTSVPLGYCQRYKDWYADYRGYKQLGTLEEVREAVEKQRAKKATNIMGDKMKFCTCPSCEKRITNVEGGNYCQNCGQKLDWGEEE